jgi:trans-aconitate methyltransferase
MSSVKIHEFDGEKYKQASRRQNERDSAIVSRLKLSGSERVPDLGRGDGVLTRELSKPVPGGKVLGIDASQGMIRAAEPLSSGVLAFEPMDVSAMEFENEFYLMFSNAAL